LAYGIDQFAPTRVVDVATLTGAILVALGDNIAGMFSNNDLLAAQLTDASKATGENIWRMPLHAPYKKLLKSDFADINNIGGRMAGSTTAALFLQEFVGTTPWAHFDIAGVGAPVAEYPSVGKNASGFGVRLLLHFLQTL
ncbi:aminopeptidase, partial [Simkania negevensis]|nr:aminopeptidase [Simkania negevensis]